MMTVQSFLDWFIVDQNLQEGFYIFCTDHELDPDLFGLATFMAQHDIDIMPNQLYMLITYRQKLFSQVSKLIAIP
jgi:hypothetical protein